MSFITKSTIALLYLRSKSFVLLIRVGCAVYTRVVPINRGILSYNETVYQELYEICIACLYTTTTHFLQIWMQSQFR